MGDKKWPMPYREGFVYFQYQVKDFDRAKKFYEEIMGFEKKWVEPDWGGPGKFYDFLVMDLSKIEGNIAGDEEISDPAADERNDSSVGGIDLDLDLLEIEIQGDMMEMEILPNLEMMDPIHIDGLFPVIMNVTPVTNLPAILGAASEEENE